MADAWQNHALQGVAGRSQALSVPPDTLAGMPDWHPMLAAVEVSPGRWHMVEPAGRVYGVIELRRTADGLRYRAAHRSDEGDVALGWSTSLRHTCERVHRAYLTAMSPASAPNEGWPAHPSRLARNAE